MIYKQLFQTSDWSDKDIHNNPSKNLAELKRIEKECQKGLLYRWWSESYADGSIYYQVTKVNKATCNVLICTGICLDEWQTGEGRINIGYVEEMLRRRDLLDNLFSKK
jgi:hypothetical protein